MDRLKKSLEKGVLLLKEFEFLGPNQKELWELNDLRIFEDLG
jgi:hypothetical protein